MVRRPASSEVIVILWRGGVNYTAAAFVELQDFTPSHFLPSSCHAVSLVGIIMVPKHLLRCDRKSV